MCLGYRLRRLKRRLLACYILLRGTKRLSMRRRMSYHSTHISPRLNYVVSGKKPHCEVVARLPI